ncbi:MAG: peptidylprolyl isomerase, partial [Desulfotignum sp.]
LHQELRLAAAETRAQALLAAAMASDSLETLAQEKGLTLSATDWFTRYDMIEGIGRSDGFNQAAFSLTPEKPLSPEVLKTDQGFFIIVFKDRQIPGEDDLQVNLADIRQQLLQAKQGQYFQAWINELKEQSRIEINTQFIN